jgi:EmrB/QacA subfamily drug resistance transporter
MTVVSNASVSGGAPDVADPRRWFALVVLALAQMMVVLDGTIVNIALPTAQRALGFSNSDRQWVVTAYALAFGGLLLLGGRLSDMFGRKRVFLIGLVGFAGASALGGAATSFGMLVVARAVQGAFGALLAPAVLALLTTTFTDPAERGRAFGIYGAILGGGGAIGLILGGVLTTYASWRWTLFVNPVFAAIAFIGGAAVLRQSRSEHRPHLDLPGAITVSAGLFAVVYGFSHADTSGWQDPITLGSLVGGVVLLAAFLAIEARVANPLLPLRVVGDRNRGGSYLAIFLVVAAMFGMFLFLTYYLQTTLGYSAIRSGFAFLPMVVVLSLTSLLANGKLLPRFGPRPLVPTGMVVAAGGMIVFTQLGAHSDYVTHILPGLLLLGVGIGLAVSSSTNTATVAVEPDDAGVASAMVNTSQQIGGSIGTSFLNTIAASAVASFVASHPSSPTLAAQAALHSYTVVFWCSAGILAAGAVATFALFRSGAVRTAPAGVVSPLAGRTEKRIACP